MSTVTVQAFSWPNYQRGGTVSLRLYATEDFFSGGIAQLSSQGYFYKEVICSVSGTTISIPEFTFESTTDSSNPQAQYIAILFKDRQAKITTLLEGEPFSVPPATPTTWENLQAYNNTGQPPYQPGFYTANQIDALLADLDVAALMPKTGGIFTGDISVPDEAYGAGWNESLEVPTKNAVYDKIASIVEARPGSLDFRGAPCHVNHGKFWTQDTNYGQCYWSAWVKPVYPNITGYYISDGAGGQHNVLNGVSTDATTFTFTGNIYDGTDIWTMSSVDAVPLGETVHYEFVYNGSTFYVLLNGIATFYGKMTQGGVWTSTFAGNRKYLAGGSNGNLYVGGSDHNNFPGQVLRVRGVEGSSCGVTSANKHIPFYYDGYIMHADGATLTRANFVADLSAPSTRLFLSGGSGFEGRAHHGTMWRYEADPQSINFTDFPTFVPGEPDVANLSTYVPPAPPTPVGALVFDSFSRKNNLFIQEAQQIIVDDPTLGSTETGSLGPLQWKTAHFTGNNKGMGILYGKAVADPAYVPDAWVITDRTNVDTRVTRPAAPWASTGILARRKDATNYYKITGRDALIDFEFMESGVQTFPSSFVVTTGWTVLRVVMNGTTMSVYTDGVLAGTKTVINDAAAVNHGLYLVGPVSRADDFTIFAVI